MRLHLDQDTADALLVNLLRKAGHEVQVPRMIDMADKTDPEHFGRAILDRRVLVSKNYEDFEHLHNLILAASGHHPGVLVVREDNDRNRDMKPHKIVNAFHKLETAGVPIAYQFIILNHWR